MTTPSPTPPAVDVAEGRRLLASATPGPWGPCRHLESIEADRACPCGYRGSIWGPDGEHAVCEMGSTFIEAEAGLEPPRYPRETEIANAHIIIWAVNNLPALLSAAEQVAGMREENERLREALEERKRLPEDVIERLIALGPVEWGASAAQSDDAHCAGLAETLAVTRKDFGLEGDRQMHGVFLKGTGIIVCQTGTSPNSGKHAAIIDGALNMLHRLALEHRSALGAAP